MLASITGAAAGVLLLAAATLATADDCVPSQSFCDDPKNDCQVITGRLLFNDTTPFGQASVPALDYSQMTQECYCQLAQGICYYGSDCDRVKWGTKTLATACTPDLNSFWDGEVAMNRTSDLTYFYQSNGRSFKSDSVFLWCDKNIGPTPGSLLSPSNVTLIGRPSVPQNTTEVPLPDNVAVYDGARCPGTDINEGYLPNNKQVDAPLSTTLQNCTCQVAALAPIDDYGDGEPLNGNSFQTVCGPNFNVFWSGKGWRQVRHAVDAGGGSRSIVSDECTYPKTEAAASLVYVVASGNPAKDNSSKNHKKGDNGNASMSKYDVPMLGVTLSLAVASTLVLAVATVC
ncbi:unnamed protein product [Sympodiomycopsis kandeliae]